MAYAYASELDPAMGAPLRIVVLDENDDRRQRLCRALVGDPRVDMVTGLGPSAALEQLPRLGADVVVVGGNSPAATSESVRRVRGLDADVRVVALASGSGLRSVLAGADDVIEDVASATSPFALREHLLSRLLHITAAANGRPPLEPRPRLRLVLVSGANSVSVARLELAARRYETAIVVDAPSAGRRGVVLADGDVVRPGRVNVIGPIGARLGRRGEQVIVRTVASRQMASREVQLVDSALDAVGPGVAVLSIEPHRLAALARRRLENDGAVARRTSAEALEWTLDDMVSRSATARAPGGSPGRAS